VDAGTREREGNVRDARHGGLVVDRAVLENDGAVSVVRVLAETDVGDHVQAGEGLTDERDDGHDGTVRTVCHGAGAILQLAARRRAEQNDRVEAFGD
jgi:hypothetical protein